MNEDTDNPSAVYLLGKVHDSLEDAIAYEIKWRDEPADLEYYKKFLDWRLSEAHVNVSVNPAFTNRMLYKLLRANTDWSVYDEPSTKEM